MDQRIKELYNQAWLKVDPANPRETFVNAFARLIFNLTETMMQPGNESMPPITDMDGVDLEVIEALSELIKKRHGVEE